MDRIEHTTPLLRGESGAESTIFSYDDEDSYPPSKRASTTTYREARASSTFSGAGEPIRTSLPLRSTAASKEAQFEADSDGIEEEEDVVAIQVSQIGLRGAEGGVYSSGGGLDRGGGGGGGDEEGGGVPDWLKRGAGVFDATVNMANSILGAGIVGLPYSMRESGFVAGLVLLVGLSFLTDWTIRLIVLNAKLSGRVTYIEIMEHCFGRNGKTAVSIFQFAFGFGGMCAFCVVIGDTIPHVLKMLFPWLVGTFLTNRQFVITFFTLTISYPLSLYRNIEKLSKASAIALVSMVVIIITVTIRGPAMPEALKGDPSLRFTVVNVSNLVRSISVISFAFVCHHNSLLIYGSLKEPSMNKFGQVTHYSTIIAAAATITMSVAGYWSFEEKTLSNVLNNFPNEDVMVNIARGLFGLNMLTTLPLECFVCREVLETYFFGGEYDRKRHLVFTTSLVVTAMMVSLVTCDLGIVLELTGGLSATALAFIFPSVCYLKLTSETGRRVVMTEGGGLSQLTSGSWEDERSGEGYGGEGGLDEVELPLRPGAGVRFRPAEANRKWWQSTRPLSVACAIFGSIVLVISVWTAISDTASGTTGAVHVC